MSDKKRIIIITISVLAGTLLSFLLFKTRRGDEGLNNQDYTTLLTNFIFSIGIILAVGFFFLWKKKDDQK